MNVFVLTLVPSSICLQNPEESDPGTMWVLCPACNAPFSMPEHTLKVKTDAEDLFMLGRLYDINTPASLEATLKLGDLSFDVFLNHDKRRMEPCAAISDDFFAVSVRCERLVSGLSRLTRHSLSLSLRFVAGALTRIPLLTAGIRCRLGCLQLSLGL